MRRVIWNTFRVLVVLAVLIAITVFLVGRDNMLETALGPVQRTDVVFAILELPERPNTYLICPVDYCGTPPARISPVFDLPASDLRARWEQMMKREPRVILNGATPDGLQFDYVQRSAVFRFPDTITIRFIPLGNDRSTLAIYSRSHYGHSDLGVNRDRIERWLAQIPQPR